MAPSAVETGAAAVDPKAVNVQPILTLSGKVIAGKPPSGLFGNKAKDQLDHFAHKQPD